MPMLTPTASAKSNIPTAPAACTAPHPPCRLRRAAPHLLPALRRTTPAACAAPHCSCCCAALYRSCCCCPALLVVIVGWGHGQWSWLVVSRSQSSWPLVVVAVGYCGCRSWSSVVVVVGQCRSWLSLLVIPVTAVVTLPVILLT